MNINIFIFHGTEGYPEENWFPWLKQELEQKGYTVFVPQFPSPPIVPAKIAEWFDVLKDYEQNINENTILIGHSLGGIFLLRELEKLTHPIKAAFFIGTPIGVRPILNYDRDSAFSSFDFNWEEIKKKAQNFTVFQSNDDPYVCLDNGRELAKNLGIELSFVPNAGHFNKKAGYVKFEQLKDKVLKILENPMQKTCQACGMPLEKKEDFAGGDETAKFCCYCANTDGSIKTCEEVFEGGVQFFLGQLGGDRKMAEKITRKNMDSLPYWQDKNCELLKGETATDEEFSEAIKKLG